MPENEDDEDNNGKETMHGGDSGGRKRQQDEKQYGKAVYAAFRKTADLLCPAGCGGVGYHR